MLYTLYSTVRQRFISSSLGNFSTRKVQSWLSKRLPVSDDIVLGQKNIFILPTAYGLVYLVFVIIVFVVAVNFENSIVYGFCFLLASIFITTLMNTFTNLAGLRCSTKKMLTCFANEKSMIYLYVSSQGKSSHHGIQVEWQGQLQHTFSLAENSLSPSKKLAFEFTAHYRGRIPQQRLRVSTTYPLGLVRAWSWVRPDWDVLVYPEPIAKTLPSQQQQLEPDFDKDDFKGLRDFQVGDSLHHIAWSTLAKGQGLHVKVFENETALEKWFCWSDLPNSLDIETRLSILCAWLLDAESKDGTYGLKLPLRTIELDRGHRHQTQCLSALALYNKE